MATNKTRIASFRLSAEAHEKLYQQASMANLSSRDWLERAILNNQTKITAKPKPHKDLKPLLYHVNKAGNNLNQIAHHFNSLKRQRDINPDDVMQALNDLEMIRLSMMEALKNAS